MRRRKALQPECLSHGSSSAHTLEQTHQHVHVPQQSGDRVCLLLRALHVPMQVFPWVGQDQSKSCSQNYLCTARGVKPPAWRRNPSGYLRVWAGPHFHPGEDRLSIRNTWKCSALPQLGQHTRPGKPRKTPRSSATQWGPPEKAQGTQHSQKQRGTKRQQRFSINPNLHRGYPGSDSPRQVK